VDNDVKARTIAEFLFGAGRGRRDQILLYIGAGIGVGIILDGKLHRGITESAGEVGYNALDVGRDGKKRFPCLYTGQRDFGEILSNDVILERYRVKARKNDATMELLFADARDGSQTANRLLDEVATLISSVCINLVNMLNPEVIILGGKITEAGTPVLDRVRRSIRSDYLRAPAEAVTIVPSHLKKDGVALGAVGLVLYDLFKPTRN
jgi:glucokinase